MRCGDFLLAHFAFVHIAVEKARHLKPTFYPYVDTNRQAFCNVKEVSVTSVLPAAPLGDGLDGMSGGAPEEFGAQQVVLLRY